MSSSEPAFNKTRWADIPKVTHTNYNKWKDDVILDLSAMGAYAIVPRDDPELQPLDFDHDDNYDDWNTKAAEDESMIRLLCSPKVRLIVRGMKTPHEMWNTLETSLDTAGSYISRQDILRQFCACRPKVEEPLIAYSTKFSNYHTQLDHTDDGITDRDFHTEIFTSLPSQYAMTLIVLKHRRPLPTAEEAMHDLLEEETTTGLTNQLRDASTRATPLSHHGGCRGRGRGRSGCGEPGGRGGIGGCDGSRHSLKSKCTYSKIDSHTTDACRKRKRAQEGGNDDERNCFPWGLPGHVKVDCVPYRRIKEWWKVKKATATTALATTRECNPFWPTACVLAAATAAAATPKWVIDSGASHHMCNDSSSYSTFKKLSHPIVIELGDNHSVTTTHYGFVDIQGYQIEAVHTPTFRLTLYRSTNWIWAGIRLYFGTENAA